MSEAPQTGSAPPRLAQLIVEVRWGPQSGRKAAVAPGGTLRVGRAEVADLVIASDEKLSAVHFEIAWDGAACRLRRAPRALEIEVDGVLVDEAVIGHGAWVRAGLTDFRVWVEGAADRLGSASAGAPPAEIAEEDPGDEDVDDEAIAARERERYARESDRAHRARIAKALSEIAGKERLFAVLDAARDDRILALLGASADDYRSLYEGARGEALADVAPYLVRIAPGSRLVAKLVDEGFGRRWGVFLVSGQPFKDLRRHLRRFLMVEDDETGAPMYFRFYDPEVLRVVLPTLSVRQREELWGDIEAILFEDEDGEIARVGRDGAASGPKPRAGDAGAERPHVERT